MINIYSRLIYKQMKNLRSKFFLFVTVLVAVMAATSCASPEKMQNEVAPLSAVKATQASPAIELWIDGKLYEKQKINFQGKTPEMILRVAAKDATNPYFIDEINVFGHLPSQNESVPSRVAGSGNMLEKDLKEGIKVPISPEYAAKLASGDRLYIEFKNVYQVVDGKKVAMERSPYDKSFVINAE